MSNEPTFDEVFAAQIAKYPHMAYATPYNAGRRDADWPTPSRHMEIQNLEWREAYRAGYRSMRAEMRLNADTDWD